MRTHRNLRLFSRYFYYSIRWMGGQEEASILAFPQSYPHILSCNIFTLILLVLFRIFFVPGFGGNTFFLFSLLLTSYLHFFIYIRSSIFCFRILFRNSWDILFIVYFYSFTPPSPFSYICIKMYAIWGIR